MTDAGRHPNITLLTQSEVKSITGYVGNFSVQVLKKARFVQEKECTACGECEKACPQKFAIQKELEKYDRTYREGRFTSVLQFEETYR